MINPNYYRNLIIDYFAINTQDCERLSLAIESVDNNIYKFKTDIGNNIVINSTGLYSTPNTHNLFTTKSGKIKTFGNLKKIIGIRFDQGIYSVIGTSNLSGLIMTTDVISKLTNLKKFYFRHNISVLRELSKGGFSGDWSQIPDSLEELIILSNEPLTDSSGYINIDNFKPTSQLKILNDVNNGNIDSFDLYGNLAYLPSTCYEIKVSGKRGGIKNVSGSIPPQMVTFYIGKNDINGTIPNGMVSMSVESNNTLSGSLPTTLIDCIVLGKNTLSGTLHEGLINIYIHGYNTITGTIPSTVYRINIGGSSDLSGTFSNGIVQITIAGANTITGTLPDSITYIILGGSNTVSGNLPINALTVNITGNNTISGIINTKVVSLNVGGNTTLTGTIPSNVKIISVSGNNTISGTIPTGLSSFSMYGFNTITGDIPVTGNVFDIGGNNTVTYSSLTFPNMMYLFRIAAGSSLTSTMVDQLLIDLALVSTWNQSKLVSIQGNSAPRTSASDAAVATLISKGVTVATN